MVDYGPGFSSTEGSDTCDTCTVGYFRSGNDCVECTDGMICDVEGMATLKTLPVAKHYYRFSEESNGLYSCEYYKYPKNCVGSGDITVNESSTASRRLATTASVDNYTDETWGDATCLPTATGPLCGVCRDGSYFDDEKEQCVECDAYAIPAHTFFVICFAAILLVCLAVYTFFRKQTQELVGRMSGFAEVTPCTEGRSICKPT